VEVTVQITGQTVVAFAGALGALIVLVGYLKKAFGWFEKQDKQTDDIKEIKAELAVICPALSACLDGLIQLGANHAVPVAKEKLDAHINKEAHK
jgi:hypothetical protein